LHGSISLMPTIYRSLYTRVVIAACLLGGKATEDRELTVVFNVKSSLHLFDLWTLSILACSDGMVIAELTLLGGFQLRLASGRVVDLPGQKDRAVLAVLALDPGTPHARDKLTDLLWSDRGDAQGRDSLKHALMRIRQCLEDVAPAAITADRQSIRLDPTDLSIDVVTFEQCVREGTPQALERATSIYAGDLLSGISIRDPRFEDWLLLERQRLRRQVEEALTRLLSSSILPESRERAARQMLSLDPLREVAARALMQIQADRGETVQALKLYEMLHDRLHAELGIKPEADTTKLYETIRLRRSAPTETNAQPSPTESSKPSLSKPSIAVLAFENLGADPDQAYFSDGITEDIITELSRNHSLFVIARSSSFQYRGKPIDVIARELGVQYVIEGSVRRMGTRIRIAVQLIDTVTGIHLWTERYDRELQAIFDIQDEVTTAIVGAIAGQVQAAGIDKARRKRTDNLAAYDCFLRGLAHVNRAGPEDTIPAREMFARATEIDPDFAQAHAMLAWILVEIHWTEVWRKNSPGETELTLDTALRAARRAVALDASDALCHSAIAYVHLVRKAFDLSAHHIDLAIKLNPNDAESFAGRANVEVFTGHPQKALQSMVEAIKLNPVPPNYYWEVQGLALYHLRRYDEAARAFERAPEKRAYIYRYLAASYAQMGRREDAQAHTAESLRLQPDFTIQRWAEIESYQHQCDIDHMVVGMRKAGLPM